MEEKQYTETDRLMAHKDGVEQGTGDRRIMEEQIETLTTELDLEKKINEDFSEQINVGIDKLEQANKTIERAIIWIRSDKYNTLSYDQIEKRLLTTDTPTTEET